MSFNEVVWANSRETSSWKILDVSSHVVLLSCVDPHFKQRKLLLEEKMGQYSLLQVQSHHIIINLRFFAKQLDQQLTYGYAFWANTILGPLIEWNNTYYVC